eukprot:1193782-Prorocentrum_minimum.AAC.2
MASAGCCVGGRVAVPSFSPLPLNRGASRKVVQVLKPARWLGGISSIQRPLGERKPQPQARRVSIQAISARSQPSDEATVFNPAAATLMLDMLASDPASIATTYKLPSLTLLSALVSGLLLIPAVPAEAALISEDALPEWALNAFGFLYIAFFGYFVIRLFRKRAKFATTTTLATKKDPGYNPEDKYKKPVDPLEAFGGSLIAFTIAFFFYQGSTKIDASFAGKSLPDTYEIAQIVITIRTIVSGLAYLATCVFGANAVGLFFLGINATIKRITGQNDLEEEETTAPVEKPMDDREYITTVEAYLAKKEKETPQADLKAPSKANTSASLPIVIKRYDDRVAESEIDNPKL